MNTSRVFTKGMLRYGFLLCVLCALAGMAGTGWAAETTSSAQISPSKAAAAAKKEKILAARIAAMEWQSPAAFTPSIDVGAKSFSDAANEVNLESLKKPASAPQQNKSPFSWNLAFGEDRTGRDKEFDSGHRYEDFIRRNDKEQNAAGTLLPFKADEVLPAKEVMFGMRVAF